MKKRILFGFSAGLQEDLERYQGVAEVAREEGWELHGIHEYFESTLTRLIRAGAVDGVISDFISDAWLGDLPERLPLVHAGRRGLSPRVSSVSIDGQRLGEQAAAHLRERGYESLVLWSPVSDPDLETGFFRGQTPKVIRTLEELSVCLAGTDPERPIGVLGASDYEARRTIQWAQRQGLAVPQHIGVLGVGDRFWDAVVAEQGISSIPLPQQRLGQEAAKLLRERLRGDRPRSVVLPPGALIARNSTLRTGSGGVLAARVEGIFRENLAHPPDMEELSRRLGMSRRAFENAFKAQTGQTPYQHLLTLRTREACRLMQETPWPLARIGETIGYPEPARFSAFFKKQLGTPPGHFRIAQQH